MNNKTSKTLFIARELGIYLLDCPNCAHLSEIIKKSKVLNFSFLVEVSLTLKGSVQLSGVSNIWLL
jgi:hypothetical protein